VRQHIGVGFWGRGIPESYLLLWRNKGGGIRMKYLSLVCLAVVIVGCTHRVAVRPTIQPSALIAEKLPYSVGIVFSDEMKDYEEHVTPSSGGTGHTYDFEIGSSLCAALRRSVETAYESVVETATQPRAAEYDRVIKFSLQNSKVDVYFQEGFLTTTARADYSLSIGIEAYDGENLDLLRRNTVSGTGFSSKGADAFGADKSFAEAIEDGVQQVSDNVANLLISGFAEPKETE
jgi:hypothetical protein